MKKLIVFISLAVLLVGIVSAKSASLLYVNWAEGIAMTNLAKVILEDKMGYDVEITQADAGVIYATLAKGNKDAFMDAWLPVTHESYMDKYSEDLLNLGYNFRGTQLGLVVPEYVSIDSITELNENADKFNNEIVGIDAGAGIMQNTEKALDVYNLDNLELRAGSGPMMTAQLGRAINKEDWVVVTGWKPHWKFGRWDLKVLEDPQNVYGRGGTINTVAREDLIIDKPELAQFLAAFQMDISHLGGLMDKINQSNKSEEEVAREWMNNNEEYVEQWIPNQ